MIGNGFISAWGNLDPAAFSPTLFDAVVTTSAELVAAITDATINTIFIRDGAYTLAASYDLGAAANNVTMFFGETKEGVIIDMNGNAFTNSNQATHPVAIINMTVLDGRIRQIGTHSGASSYMGGLWNVIVDLNSNNALPEAFFNCRNMYNCVGRNGLGTPLTCYVYNQCHAMYNVICEDNQDCKSFYLCSTAVGVEIVGNTATVGPGLGSFGEAFDGCNQFDMVTVSGDWDGGVFQSCREFTNVRCAITEAGDTNNSIFEDCFDFTNLYLLACTISGTNIFETCYNFSDIFFEGGANCCSFNCPGGTAVFATCYNLKNIIFQDDPAGTADTILEGVAFGGSEFIDNVIVNIRGLGALDPTVCFDACYYMSNITVDRFEATAGGTTAFQNCAELVNCDSASSTVYVPYTGCQRLVNCMVTALPNAAGAKISFTGCSYVTQCQTIGDGANLAIGFNGCDHVLWCVVTVGSATADYSGCTNVFESVGAGAVQYLNCTFVGGDYIGLTNIATPVTCYSGVQYDNTGAGGAVVYNLPAPAKDDKVRFICTVAQDMVVTAQAGDTMYINGVASTAGGTATLDVIGTVLELVAIDGNSWYAVAAVGGPIVTA